MSEKIKILIVPSDNHGVGKYRSVDPAKALDKFHSDEFDVSIEMGVNWSDVERLKQYDIIHFHKGIEGDQESFWTALEELKKAGVKIMMDVDDVYWELNRTHPQYYANVFDKIPEKVRKTMGLVDCMTTTTPIFAKEVRKYNKNVYVMPNGLDPEEPQVATKKIPSKNGRIRFGFIMGSSHEPDLEIMRGTFAKLQKEVIDKIEIHLCGYDIRGANTLYYPDGRRETVPIKPLESCWHRFEMLVTDNYNPKYTSEAYKEFLLQSIPDSEWANVDNERYVRQWTRDINNYMTQYDTVDVLLVPLAESKFNSCKSQLKLIEAAFKDTAVVCSDFGPYQLDTISLIEKGGTINPDGNAILIDEAKNHKAWAKAIEKLANNPELIETLKTNLKKTIIPKYNLKVLSDERVKIYKEVLGKA